MARILVVDDAPEMRQLISELLLTEDHQVATAENGRKAIEIVEADPPDLVILDVMMPVMDGYSVLRDLRRKGLDTRVKILLLTA
ncbi:MAG: response regulator, partial [Actinomycetota bacterium]